MKRSEERILTTHVGSLVRPQELLDLSGPEMMADEESRARYEDCLKKSVSDVVRKQAEVGLDIINDGEFGKHNWATYILNRIDGLELRADQRRFDARWLGRDLERFPETVHQDLPWVKEGVPVIACIGELHYLENSGLSRDIANFKAALGEVDAAEGFLPVVAPASAAFDAVDEFYGNERDYIFAVAEALRQEYLAIHNSGLLVQVDDAVLANMFDSLVQESPERYRDWAQLRIEALNHALRGIPEEGVRYHICFGSWHIPHTADAELEDIVDLILQVNAGAYLIEAANPRHEHEWRVWEKVAFPQDKILIPGVITHHTVSVEHPRLVADRIIRFANILGKERIIAGSDCGFAQVEGLKRVFPNVMWAKFESLVEGARIASRELWQNN